MSRNLQAKFLGALFAVATVAVVVMFVWDVSIPKGTGTTAFDSGLMIR